MRLPEPVKWAAVVPFYGMPVVLTLLAWDLYGGFAVHGLWLLGMAACGAAFGALRHRLSDPGDIARRGRSVAARVAVLGIAAQIPMAAALVAGDTLARVDLGPMPAQPGGVGLLLVQLGFTALVLRAGWRTTEVEAGKGATALVGVGWILALLGARFAYVGSNLTPAFGVGLLVLAGAAGLRGRLGETKGVVLGGGLATGAFAGVMATGAVLRATGGMGDPLGPITLVSGSVGLAVGAFAQHRLPSAWPRLEALAASLDDRLDRLPLPFVLVVAALISFNLAALTADVVTMIGPSPPSPSDAPLSDPGSLGALPRLLFVVLLVRVGLTARSPRDATLAAGLGLAGWACLVALAIGGNHDLAGLRGLAVVLLAAVLVLGWRPAQGAARGASIAGWVLAGALFAPVVARYAVACVPSLGDPLPLARVAPLVGAAVGFGARAALLRLPADLELTGAARRLFLACLSAALVIYFGVFFALMPVAFVGTVAVIGILAVATRLTPAPTLSPAAAVWLLFYASFFATVQFKEGPSAEACAAIVDATSARVLLDRHRDPAPEGAPYAEADPYDLLPDGDADKLVVTFKRFDRRGGWLEVIDIDQPTQRTRLTTQRPDGGGPLWPERFVRDPRTDRYYFGMLGIDAYALWETEIRDGEMQILRTAPLAWEPSYPAMDTARGVLVQSYLAAGIEASRNRGFEQPLVELIDVDRMKSVGRWSFGPETSEMSEFAAVDPASGRYWIPAYFNLVRFALIEVDPEGPEPTRAVETFHPSIAVAPDPDTGRMFVTNSLGGTLDTYDLETLKRVGVEPSGGFPRDLVLDRLTGRVYIGNYSSGTVSVFATRSPETADGAAQTPRKVADIEVGPVLRGIGLHEGSGRVFAASACGVFEVLGPGAADG